MGLLFWQGGVVLYFLALNSLPTLKPQEIPLDHPDSNNMFQPSPDKPFVATPTAIEMYSNDVIMACCQVLRGKADQHSGLDYLQVFEDESKSENLLVHRGRPGRCNNGPASK